MSSNSAWGGAGLEDPSKPLDSDAPVSVSPPPAEDPPFGGLEVLKIGLLIFVVPIMMAPSLVVIAQQLLYPPLTLAGVAPTPWVSLGPLCLWCRVVALHPIAIPRSRFRHTFWRAVRPDPP